MAQFSFLSTFLTGVLIGAVLPLYEVLQIRAHINRSIEMSLRLLDSTFNDKNLSKIERETENKAVSATVKVLCWVMTHPGNHKGKAKYIMQTWGKRCNKFIFVSDGKSDDSDMPIVSVNASSGRQGLWQKVQLAFLHIHEHYRHDYDWFMKADDDTYVNVQALKRFLLAHDTKAPLFFGEQFISAYGQRYMAGGGGYVLSRETLEQFVNLLKDKRTDEEVDCSRSKLTSEEDPSISYCLNILKIKGTDSRDSIGLNRFAQHSGVFRDGHWNSKSNFYWNYQHYKSTQIDGAVGCCSNTMISFHYQGSGLQFINEFLIYSVNPEDTSLTVQKNLPS